MTALNLAGRELWVDFRGVPPSWDQFYAKLKAFGVVGVLRYIDAGSESKQIHAVERLAAAKHGIRVLLVDEHNTGDAWDSANDRAAGAARGAAAVADATREGFGQVGIAAAADAHADRRQVADAVQYATGFASKVGKTWAGMYGFLEVLRAVRAAGVVSWFWAAGSMPTAEDASWLAFWQDNRGPVVIGGVECDRNWRLDGPLPGTALTKEEFQLSTTAESQVYSTYAMLAIGSHGDGWVAPAIAPTIGVMSKQLTALVGAVADLSKDPNITAAQLQAMLDDSMKMAGQEAAAQILPALTTVVQTVLTNALGADNEAQAQAIVAELLGKIGALFSSLGNPAPSAPAPTA